MKDSFLRKWVIWFRGELESGGALVITRPALLTALECMIRFGVAFILSGAQVFGQYRPFAVGFIAASGSTAEGLCGFLGATLGYILLAGFGGGLKYIAIMLLVVAMAFIFRDLGVSSRRWFMPLISGAITLAVGLVFEIEAGLALPQLVYFVTEVALVSVSSGFYALAVEPVEIDEEEKGNVHNISLLLMAGTLFIALNQIELIAGMSLGRLAASGLLLIAAYRGGASVGAVIGMTTGIAMDMASGTMPLFSMIYGFSGLICGLASGKSKLAAAVSFVFSSGMAALWTWNYTLMGGILYEVFVASVVFMVLPTRYMPRMLSIPKAVEPSDSLDSGLTELARKRLEAAAAAFRQVYESLMLAVTASKTNDNDISTVFDRTADKVCRKCVLCNHCWEKNYITTYNALNDATPRMLNRGKSVAADYPIHFSSKCRDFEAFVAKVNEELTAMSYRARYRNRLNENKKIICGQYEGLSQILDSAAAELGGELAVCRKSERKLRRYIKTAGIEAEACVYTDHLGRVRAEITGPDLTELLEREALTSRVSSALGVQVSEPSKTDTEMGQKLCFSERETFCAISAFSARQKEGEQVSGDYGTYFKTPEGDLYVILSDGMGTGPAAAKESGTAVRLLEKLLRAGAPPKTAMDALNSAYLLRGEDQVCFATVDLLRISLFTGESSFYKWGAAPSYIKRGEEVRRIGTETVPPGFDADAGAEVSHIRLEENDYIIIISDGVADRENDQWLRETASSYDGGSPGELSCRIMEKAEEERSCKDDMTVFVFKLETAAPPVALEAQDAPPSAAP